MTFYVFLSCCTRFLEHWICIATAGVKWGTPESRLRQTLRHSYSPLLQLITY